jgi:hypothetical protein
MHRLQSCFRFALLSCVLVTSMFSGSIGSDLELRPRGFLSASTIESLCFLWRWNGMTCHPKFWTTCWVVMVNCLKWLHWLFRPHIGILAGTTRWQTCVLLSISLFVSVVKCSCLHVYQHNFKPSFEDCKLVMSYESWNTLLASIRFTSIKFACVTSN